MDCLRAIACIAIGLASCAGAAWQKLACPVTRTELPVWKPDDLDPSRTHPAIVFYHGMGGQPTAEPIHRITRGKDFVLVGMAYRHQGRFTHTEPEIAAELGLLNAMKQTLTTGFAVDPKRIYVGGFSKGGWHSALLLDRDRSLAGGLILGSGITVARPEAPKFTNPVPIFIGCGRYDGNYPPSLGALVYFRKLGAEVTQESWPDTAHAFPEDPPEGMRQWLRIQAATGDLAEEAATWIAARHTAINDIEEPVAQWFALEQFTSLPFVRKFGGAATEAARAKMALLSRDPKVAAEQHWRDESRRLLASESRDRLLTTLQAAARGYEQLAAKAKGTRAGTEALQDVERTRTLLKTTTVVTRPGPGPAAPITPEGPINLPSSPTGNPERSPFFPPGSKVKPAK